MSIPTGSYYDLAHAQRELGATPAAPPAVQRTARSALGQVAFGAGFLLLLSGSVLAAFLAGSLLVVALNGTPNAEFAEEPAVRVVPTRVSRVEGPAQVPPDAAPALSAPASPEPARATPRTERVAEPPSARSPTVASGSLTRPSAVVSSSVAAAEADLETGHAEDVSSASVQYGVVHLLSEDASAVSSLALRNAQGTQYSSGSRLPPGTYRIVHIGRGRASNWGSVNVRGGETLSFDCNLDLKICL